MEVFIPIVESLLVVKHLVVIISCSCFKQDEHSFFHTVVFVLQKGNS